MSSGAALLEGWANGYIVPVGALASYLAANHYLGAANRGIGWSDEWGALVLGQPNARRLPQDGTWLELSRWCLLGIPNGGSQQWARVRRWLRVSMPEVTTVVSYSDPAQGHTGALYRACGWLWAPTWHRLRPPPSGNGSWRYSGPQAVKDRWVCPLQRDARRPELLAIHDDALVKRGAVGYQEPRRV